ncbi:WD40/YVTN/BNR-like repeat-containing protein [candidate division KSB1 bacterium]
MQKTARYLLITGSLCLFFAVLLFPCKFVLSQSVPTTSEERMRSWEQHVRMQNGSIFRELKWRAVGPQKQGGRIESIAIPPGNTSVIYVGPGSGNLWKTVNNGTTWEPVFEHESTFAIGSVAVSASHPDIVWVGTGEVLMARSSYAGTGVFKSTDAGKTWQNMGLQDTHHIGRVLIDPEDPDIVYTAALGHMYSFNEERGLFKTTDGGKSWSKCLYISDKVGVVDVVMDPSDRQILYAVTWERDRKAWGHVASGEGSGIYKTTDGGSTWEKLTNGLPSGEYIGRYGIAVSVSNPNVVYSLLDNRSPNPSGRGVAGGEVYRSDDKGNSWRKVNEGSLNTAIGYDFCLIKISPHNENEIYVLGNYLLTSTDGGRTYERNNGTLVHILPHHSQVLHLDQHDMLIDPVNPDRLLLGNDGGFHISYDRGKTWLHLNNLPIGEFYAVSADMETPYNIYGGTQDNAALFGPSTYTLQDGLNDPWQHIYIDRWGGGDSYFTWVDPTDRNTVYYEHQFGDLRRKNLADGTTKSIQPRAPRGEPRLRYNWMSPFFISHYDPATLYYGANKLFKSLNRGDDWTCISPDLTTEPGPDKQGNVPFGTITSVSESQLQPGLLYVGSDDGNIQVTHDDGATWNLINSGLPAKWVSRVTASQHDLGTVYASFTGYREDDFGKYLYMSTDHGTTWRSISGNLPSESINVIREDPKNSSILYIGTDMGVYVTLDKGGSWISLCNNLPTTPVYDLVIHPRDNELVIGTHGRSVFVLEIESIQEHVGKED